MNFSNNLTVINNQVVFSDFLIHETTEEVIAKLLRGLSSDDKHISSRFFYDSIGSELFEKITLLPEYYPTVTEKSILKEFAPIITKALKNIDIIELGSGDCSKISILLSAFSSEHRESIRYFPVDVSKTAILKSTETLTQQYPEIVIHGIIADFMKHLRLIPVDTNRLICFFGSTLGNLTHEQAIKFLADLKALLKPGDQILLGLDMVKDVEILHKAYNDNKGITAAFNKNILNSINHYLESDFNPESFKHSAYYNSDKARIEMHLHALKDMEVSSPFCKEKIRIKEGESIHTENSHKFTADHISNFAALSGLGIREIYTDEKQWFSIVHFEC
jgi:L-histidine Nalpha-methyltransferase